MKRYILVFCLLLISIQIAKAQPCGLNQLIGLTDIYVFSDRENLNMQEILGPQVNSALINIIKIKTPEQKQSIDSLCLSEKITYGIFIFPGNTEQETKRYCSAKEYSAALKNQKTKEMNENK